MLSEYNKKVNSFYRSPSMLNADNRNYLSSLMGLLIGVARNGSLRYAQRYPLRTFSGPSLLGGDDPQVFTKEEVKKITGAEDATEEKVKEYHLQAGNSFLHGPVNPSTNYESGLLIEGFDDPPKIMMTYNPPYYIKLLEGFGMNLEMRMFAYKFEEEDVLKNEKFLRVKDVALMRSKCTLRFIDPKKLNLEIDHIKKIYNTAWENNWGFVPMSDPELELMANELKLILDPSLAPMIVNEHGEVIAFALAMRDINQITKDFNGNLFPLNFLKLIFNKGKMDWLRVLLLGILPEYRGKGLDAVLYYEIIKNGFDLNIKHAEASWILESNEGMNKGVQVVNGQKYKTYGIYQLQIGSE
jgi:hypothetical protein